MNAFVNIPMLPATGEQLMTDADVARMYRISRRTIWLWVKKDRFPKPDISRDGFTRWRRTTVENFISQLAGEERREAAG